MCFYEQFDEEIPQNIQTKILEFSEFLKNEKIIGFMNSESVTGEATIEPIFGVRVPGYVPFQCGGVDISTLIHFSSDPSYSITDGMANHAKETFINAMTDFKFINKISNNTDYSDFSDDEKNNFSDFESEYLQPSLLRFSIFVDEDKQNMVMEIGVNYIDAPYYTVKFDETMYTHTIPLEKFLNSSFEELWDIMIQD